MSTSDRPATDADPEDESGLIGKVLGEFRLIRRLGQGGMADVFLAEQTTLKRQVAVKLLRTASGATPDARQLKRFEREAMAAGGLTHANIVQVYSIGEQDGLHYIAQEYVPGQNLKEFISKKGPPSVPAAIHIMRQVAMALQAAGEAGVVHRDIKPENIMITRRGEAKVADFGLAQLNTATDVQLTQEGITMGTPLYMSPEQVHGKSLDHRSDIYSFGVTGYHLLTGAPPFTGETALSVAVQHLNNTASPLRSMRVDVPPPLAKIVARMMHKDPDARYQSASEVLQDLKKVHRMIKENEDYAKLSAKDFSTTGEIDADADSRRQRFANWSGRRDFIGFVITAFLVAASSATLGWVLRPKNPLSTPPPVASQTENTETSADDELARLRLALDYMQEQKLAAAEGILLDLTGGTPRQKANAAAGLALLANYRGEYEESWNLLAQDVKPAVGEILPELHAPLIRAENENRRQLGREKGLELAEDFREGEPLGDPLGSDIPLSPR